MLLADGIHASFQSLDVVAVGYLRWGKDRIVARLGFVRCTGRKLTQGHLINEAMLQDLERYVGARANAD
jgi:hypothetical protein